MSQANDDTPEPYRLFAIGDFRGPGSPRVGITGESTIGEIPGGVSLVDSTQRYPIPVATRMCIQATRRAADPRSFDY